MSYTYTNPGDYRITVDVKDKEGATTKSGEIRVYAGNEEPKVTIQVTGGNKSFYIPGKPLKYAVSIKDNDTAKIDPVNLYISADYVEGFDKAGSSMGHQQGQASVSGKNLMLSLDCKSCHKETEKSVGPAYLAVSQKYQKNPDAMNHLTNKIIKGGSGVWGEVAMPAHPTLAQGDVAQIVTWILSLGNKAAVKKSLSQTGNLMPLANQKPNAMMVLSASYTDKGGNNIKALTGSTSLALRSSTISFKGNEKVQGFTSMKFNGMNLMLLPQAGGWFAIDSIDLTDVKSANLVMGWQEAPKSGLDFEARLDGNNGKVIGSGSLPVPKAGLKTATAHINLQDAGDGKFHTVYFVYKPKDLKIPLQVGITAVQFSGQ
ncbi:MAG: c-type cytochrome [Segetibacter sp.]